MTSFSCSRLSLEHVKATLGVRDSCKIGNNTYLRRDVEGGGFTVTYHGKGIIRINKRGDMRLDSCGFQTLTTKERFNALIPSGFWILQKDHVWYLTGPNAWKPTNGAKGIGLVFCDGMVITAKGQVRGGIKPGTDKDPIRVQKQITKYVDGFVKAFFAGEVEAPGPGDCWFCAMTVSQGGKDNKDVGKSLGEASGDKDHILGHIKENYFVPSLMLRACRAFPVSPYVGSMINGIWGKTEPSLAMRDLGEQQLKYSLSKYVRRELGIVS
jgi:hypothetical protein